jgi:hypothetical protein
MNGIVGRYRLKQLWSNRAYFSGSPSGCSCVISESLLRRIVFRIDYHKREHFYCKSFYNKNKKTSKTDWGEPNCSPSCLRALERKSGTSGDYQSLPGWKKTDSQ